MNNIEIIDAPCGSGKTEYIIRYMNDHPEQPFLYISPLREMFDRIEGKGRYEGRGVVTPFRTPDNMNHKHTKLESIKQLFKAGENVMSTHALFMMFDDEAIEILKGRDYHLIIDEAISAATVIKTSSSNEDNDEDEVFRLLEQHVKEGDIQWLVQHGAAKIDADDYGAIKWIDEYTDVQHRYADLERMIKSGAMSQVKDTFLIWHFPTKVLDAFKEITVLTYRFRHSIMRCYLDFNEMSYDHKTVLWEGDHPQLVGFNSNIEKGDRWAEYINIFEDKKLNAVGVRDGSRSSYPLSYSWYRKSENRLYLKTLKDNCTNYFRHKMDAPKHAVMWTTYKAAQNRVKPQGYVTNEIRNEDGTIVKKDTWVACTCKATEQYKDKYILAYLIDRHLNPGLERFFEQKGVTIDKDEWSLSELIQWLFRSRIRDDRAEDRRVFIYIPSDRMRRLLKKWIGKEKRRVIHRTARRAS